MGTDDDGLALARVDFNVNGPLAGDDWRFNLGGFYRYDHGVRDPGFPGIRGGQLKASVTRLLDNGYIRASFKGIDDRNQFILPLPFRNPSDPEYVPGFTDYGAMNTAEGLHLRVPTPEGRLELPLDDGLRTRAFWLSADARFELGDGWSIRNTAQIMQNDQGWNAILPFDIKPADVWVNEQIGSMGLPAGSRWDLFFTNHEDAAGNRLRFNTANGLVSPGGQWHVEKPLTAAQNQFQIWKEMGPHNLSLGLYFGHYTQTNRWFFTDILMDVRDQPRFLDLVVYDPQGNPIEVTKNGFRKYTSFYVNAAGHTTIFSGVLGGSFRLSDRLRMDAGLRYEFDDFVQSTENRTNVDLDSDPSTPYDNVNWGDGSFQHFSRSMDDLAGSIGLNYRVNDNFSVYGLAARAYKMPALDEFIFGEDQARVDLFEASNVRSIEAGVKYATPRYGLAVNGFVTELRNIVGQGAVTDPQTGAVKWILQENPETRALGTEVEFKAQATDALEVLATGTLLKAEYATCPEETCPGGADLGTFLNGVPPVIGNLALMYTTPGGGELVADWHYVHRRFSAFSVDGKRNELPTYHYLNLGATYPLGVPGMSVSANILNVFQSKGLEEGNPRLTEAGGRTSDLFLARPILPRRLTFSLRYDF